MDSEENKENKREENKEFESEIKLYKAFVIKFRQASLKIYDYKKI